jgi:hypothetical protein
MFLVEWPGSFLASFALCIISGYEVQQVGIRNYAVKGNYSIA